MQTKISMENKGNQVPVLTIKIKINIRLTSSITARATADLIIIMSVKPQEISRNASSKTRTQPDYLNQPDISP